MKTRRLLTGLLIAAFVLSASPALEAQSIHFRLGSDGVGLSVNSGHHSHVHYCDDDWEDYYKHARKHYKKHHKHHTTEYKKRKKHHKRHHDNGHHYGKRKIKAHKAVVHRSSHRPGHNHKTVVRRTPNVHRILHRR